MKELMVLEIVYDYIHGKSIEGNTIKSNNMVLGIDEYLPEKRRDKEVEFIAFKKYYQRIYKQTGCKYKEWIDKIKEEYLEFLEKQKGAESKINTWTVDMYSMLDSLAARAFKKSKCNKHNLYIFGHSLDVTDKDIFKTLILNDNVYTTIFYHEKKDDNGNGDKGRKDLGQKVANLVKVIGQDELIRRTGGITKTIEFKLQSEMRY